MSKNRKLYLSVAGAALFSISAVFASWASPQDKSSCNQTCLSGCLTGCDTGDFLCETNCYRSCGCIIP